MLSRLIGGLGLVGVCGALALAQETPSAGRTVEVHLHALSRGYLRPLHATVARVAAMPGISSVESSGFGGDVLRLRVTTGLSDTQLVALFQLQKVGGGEGRLLLAADKSPRVQRAEARAVLLDICRAINSLPAPDWRSQSKPIFENARSFTDQMRVLGLDPKLANGVFYGARDYHIVENHDRWSASYQLWAGKEWAPVSGENRWDETPRSAQSDPRFVGLMVRRSAWDEGTQWVDEDGARMNNAGADRSATDSSGRLKVQDGAEWMAKVMRRAVAVRLRKDAASIRDLPAGRGWGVFSRLEANDLQRWGGDPYDSDCLSLSWTKRDSDGHLVASLKAFHDGHPFFLHAEVDSDAVAAAYKDAGISVKDLKDADLGNALVWVVGAESGPEVFQQRQAEAGAAIDTLMAALGKLPAGVALAELAGPLSDEKLARLGMKLEGRHFAAKDYLLSIQAFGDVEIAVGTPMTGGRWWTLGNPAAGQVIRSDR